MTQEEIDAQNKAKVAAYLKNTGVNAVPAQVTSPGTVVPATPSIKTAAGRSAIAASTAPQQTGVAQINTDALNRAIAINQAKNPERILWDANGKIVPSVTAYDSQVERQREAQQAPGIREGTPQTGMKIYTPYGMVESTPPPSKGALPVSPSFAGAGPVPNTFGGDRRLGIVNAALQPIPIGRPPVNPDFAGAGAVPSTFGGGRRLSLANTALPLVPKAPSASFNAPAPMQPFITQIRYPGKPGGLSQTTGVKALKRFGQRRVQAAKRFYENATPWFRPEYSE